MATSSFPTAFVRVPLAGHALLDQLDWSTIAQLIQAPRFLEALYIASPALYDEARKLDLNPDLEPNEKTRRVLYSLIKYLSRYASRCTPFGLFSGFSTLPISAAPTQVRIEPAKTLRKVTRLDMNYLCALAQDLEKHPAIQPYLRFFPNSSLYTVNGQYRYVAYRYEENRRVHHLTGAEQNEYLDGILTLARTGATIDQLAVSLCTDEISEEDARAYIGQILDAQLLVSELEPALTGDDFLAQIITTLQTIYQPHPDAELAELLALLTEIQTDLKALEQTGSDYSTEKYQAIEQKISRLSTPYDRKVLFQVDAYLPQTEGQLNKGLLNKLISKIPTLLKLVPPGQPTLDTFRNQFLEKYEEEEVPLVVVLDPEMGLGYPAGQAGADISPLIEGIGTGSSDDSEQVSIPSEHRYLFQKIAEAQVTGAYEIEIQEDELRNSEARQTALPLTNSAMFSVIREAGREKLVLNNFDGMTGTYLLGRFGHTDPSVLELMRDISRAEDEARPDLIFADIVHLPEARTGNIIIRPQLKTYQIPFLGKASADPEHTLPVTDLMVRMEGQTIRLRSKSLNKTIIPRLSNAHYYGHPDSLDLYHFLCDVQTQHQRTTLSYFIGSASKVFLFVPRLVLDTLILSEAQWHFRDSHVRMLVAAFKKGNNPELMGELGRWRTQYRIPRFISLVDFDNDLYVDLENPCLAETFVNEIKSRPSFTIKEFLYRADSAVVESDQGWHTNQFVVAFHHQLEKPVNTRITSRKPTQDQAVLRKFITGSEWLYYKIYTGIKTAEKLLTEVMLPLTERIKTAGWIDGFFFIRYADPHHHIRFRFHLTDTRFTGEVIRELHDALAPYLANRSITSVVTDTYNRELERYGSNSIQAAEAFFHVDSHAILQFLSQIEGEGGEECRWRFGLKMTHELLDSFGFDWPQRIGFTEQRAAWFGKEFGYNPAQKKQLDGRYKAIETALLETLDETNDEHRFFYDLCHERTEWLHPMISHFRSLHEQGALTMPLDDLLSSLIHMTINRLFRSRQRLVEYAIYFQLHKYYRITYGRMKHARPALLDPSVSVTSLLV
ncbi:lantibiotic dehydratase [Larkinella sp. VNQ87]|uniref:lantibiotic dehydratase n=1 Tax=Larkinella sp. VNQ87 TaxID=3400921 RepID=UPI003C05412D